MGVDDINKAENSAASLSDVVSRMIPYIPKPKTQALKANIRQ
jgi:hypothetical protein